ncbi:MAG: class II fructose-bisphosphatase [Anaerolineae bacterium]
MSLSQPDRNLALELVRVTEAAALAAGRWMGLGQGEVGRKAAIEAMRVMLCTVQMQGVVVSGGGPPGDESDLACGETIGNGEGALMDVAVDPIEGVGLLANGRGNALSVIAVSDHGTMFDPAESAYMYKIAAGPAASGVIDIEKSVEQNLRAIAQANRKDLDDLTTIVLDRPRHAELIDEIRETGARIRLITDGDVAGAIMTAVETTGIDALFGVGGTAEGVIAACALRCLGGGLVGRLVDLDEDGEVVRDPASGPGRILERDDLVAGDNVFFAATGITNGELLRGVQYTGTGAETYSVTMRSRSGTIRTVDARHRWDKLMQISQVAYDER